MQETLSSVSGARFPGPTSNFMNCIKKDVTTFCKRIPEEVGGFRVRVITN